jgi:predicted PolB exonuclease-like 3'-5' exonuclease
MEGSVIVWDLETVPDLVAAGRLHGMVGSTDADVRAELGEKFPKLILHKIACVGALIAFREVQGWRISALGAPHIGERPEHDLIRDFTTRIAELKPLLVTYNGHSFDLPVLRYRAMVNRVAAHGLFVRPYFHRFSDDAIDLCDVLGSFQSSSKVKLDDLAKALGFAGKPDEVDGSKVEEMVAAGRIEDVARYCESDVVNTYRIWLVYEFMRGALSQEGLDWSEATLQSFLLARFPSKRVEAPEVPGLAAWRQEEPAP